MCHRPRNTLRPRYIVMLGSGYAQCHDGVLTIHARLKVDEKPIVCAIFAQPPTRFHHETGFAHAALRDQFDIRAFIQVLKELRDFVFAIPKILA